ncbi:serpin family protein [Paenibacillus donghaensis]|uniref:Serpin domain-containing protein n=1 Tax=Paenibacillus donghaensis TaxID=414771 RepID=A0A2Z2KAK9_9BACL|nr:serpin family protein [Paenibacillus donghaensis]ASA23716.1 hypothetical protein B9T62_24760 [Paenibacillus donghaensis]
MGLAELAQELAQGKLAEGNFTERRGRISLPRFRAEYGLELKQAFQALGMKQAFDSSRSNFTGIADITAPIYIGTIVHKTYIEVNEQGTEAAASTLVGMRAGAAPSSIEPFEMNVNRPFLYLIEDKLSGVWLFLGTINNPLDTQ